MNQDLMRKNFAFYEIFYETVWEAGIDMDVLKKILKAYTDEEITPESRLIEDLGLDSFLVIYVLSEVEDAFDTRIEDYSSIVTVRDILDCIKMEGKGA